MDKKEQTFITVFTLSFLLNNTSKLFFDIF